MKQLLTLKKQVALFFLALLGFSACDSKQMYGTPTAEFELLGTIVDEKGNGINGISITTEIHNNSTALTNTKGEFSLITKEIPIGGDNIITYTLKDIDGKENGGEFEQKQYQVQYTEEDRTANGDKGWYQGRFTKKETITLSPKK